MLGWKCTIPSPQPSPKGRGDKDAGSGNKQKIEREPVRLPFTWLCELATQGHKQPTPYPTLAVSRGLHPFHKLFQTSEHMFRVLVVGLDDLHHGGAGDGTGGASGNGLTHLSRLADAKAE